jgi:Dehydrogenases with different specificities (related to short-chain alcohol dehydrogenases)
MFWLRAGFRSRSEMNKSEKTVVITGAVKGLGKSLSLAFAGVGYEVIGLYRADDDAAETLRENFRAEGFRGSFIRQDITAEGNWSELDEIIAKRADASFTLIANACPPFAPKPFYLTEWREFSALLEVNVKGTFALFQRLLPSMVRAREGTFISVLSAALEVPPKGFAAYVTAKSALEGLTRAVAAEYASRGIRVFSVSPGFMETSLTAGWNERLKILIRSGGVLQPEDVAQEILELALNRDIPAAGENYICTTNDKERNVDFEISAR